MERSSPGGGGVWSAFSNPVRVSLHFSSSRRIQLDLSRPHPLHEKFSPSRGILIGIPRDGEKFSWRGWGMVCIFKSRESFSPFLLISSDSVRFVQTSPPPREVLSISWDFDWNPTRSGDLLMGRVRNGQQMLSH